MDTDSLYFALSANKLEEVVESELQTEFENRKKDWLAWDTFSSRTPGLFKLEFEGYRAIALCSKCYFIDGEKKSKYSSKGMSARHNSLTWGRYKAALEGNIDRAENRGFRLRHGQMTTYFLTGKIRSQCLLRQTACVTRWNAHSTYRVHCGRARMRT